MLYNSGLLLFAGHKTLLKWIWRCRWHYNVMIYLNTERQKLVVEVWVLKPQGFLSKFLNAMYVVAYFLQSLTCGDTGKIIILTVGRRQSYNNATIRCRRIPNDPNIVHRVVLWWRSRTPAVEPIHFVALRRHTLAPFKSAAPMLHTRSNRMREAYHHRHYRYHYNNNNNNNNNNA